MGAIKSFLMFSAMVGLALIVVHFVLGIGKKAPIVGSISGKLQDAVQGD